MLRSFLLYPANNICCSPDLTDVLRSVSMRPAMSSAPAYQFIFKKYAYLSLHWAQQTFRELYIRTFHSWYRRNNYTCVFHCTTTLHCSTWKLKFLSEFCSRNNIYVLGTVCLGINRATNGYRRIWHPWCKIFF